MKTEQELKEIALDIISGTIISSMTIRDKDLSTVFMPLTFMNKNQYSKFIDQKPGVIYEYFDQALPRSVNGLPIFTSMKVLDIDECHRLVKIIKELEEWSKNEKKIQEKTTELPNVQTA